MDEYCELKAKLAESEARIKELEAQLAEQGEPVAEKVKLDWATVPVIAEMPMQLQALPRLNSKCQTPVMMI